MDIRRFFAAMTGAVCAILWMAAAPAPAQESEGMDLTVQMERAIQLMQQENWVEALECSEASVSSHGNGAAELYGARFGAVYFRKGVCELKLKKWDAAMKSFEICYKEFPNKEGASPELGNPYQKTCLLSWAEAAMGAEEWQLALDLFKKFLIERDRERDDYDKGRFYINLAVCHYKLGDIAKGNENLEIAITNKESFGVSVTSVLGAFRYLVEVSIKEGNEQALLDFISKNRGEIIADPFDMHAFAGIYLKLARQAMEARMDRAALEICQLVPSPEMVLGDARAKLQCLGSSQELKTGDRVLVREPLEKGIAQIEAAEKNGQSLEIAKLATIASLHERFGNLRGACAAYRQLELLYPMAQNREDHLYQLTRLSFMAGSDGLEDARKFLATYPGSKHAPLIRRLALSGLFARHRYEECIASAREVIGSLAKGSAEHDLCLHVLGASYFYTGQYDQAKAHLDQHVADYPNSGSAVAAAYFQAANELRLNHHPQAGVLLDAFTAKYADAAENPFLSYAYYDRATVHAAEQQHAEALRMVDRLIADFADSPLMDQAHHLRGSILLSLGRPADAEGAFKQGLKLSDRSGHPLMAGSAICSLIDLLVRESKGKPGKARLAEALGYVDAFWSKYAEDSPYAREIAVSQIPVLEAAGRLDEALERLRGVIAGMSEDPEARGLEEKLDAYTEAYLKKHAIDQLEDHYQNFPGIKPASHAARALMRIQVIRACEALSQTSREPEKKAALDARVKAAFTRLKSDFDIKDLPVSILMKVGDHLRLKTATPREALPFYDEVIKRDDKAGIHEALLGRADIYGDSGNEADIDKALADLDRVWTESGRDQHKEIALCRMVELLVAKGDFEGGSVKARLYLDDAAYRGSGNAPVVALLMARALEGRKMIGDAIAMYEGIWKAHADRIGVSAPAMKRSMELLWDRNQPAADATAAGDRQSAYVAAANYIKNTSALQDRMAAADHELWKEVEALMKQYEANPNIKPIEQTGKEENE